MPAQLTHNLGMPIIESAKLAAVEMKMLKVLMITGSYPPDVCGVGDYTYNLVQALQKQAVEVGVLSSAGKPTAAGPTALGSNGTSWSMLPALLALEHAVSEFGPDIIHIQYPTIGFGRRLGPQAAAIYAALRGRKLLVTVHESKKAHLLRRLSLLAFNSATHIVTTTTEQAEYLGKTWLYPLRERISVIPIASNIPRSNTSKDPGSTPICTHFGLIYPSKGIDTFIEVARQAGITLNQQVRFRIVGNVHPAYRSYFQSLRNTAADLNIEWILGSTPEEVARLLSESLVCILPFSDGASYGRGSLLAALINGVPVITTHSNETPAELQHGEDIYFADSTAEYIECISALLNPQTYRRISKRSFELGYGFEWDTIAARHRELYRHLANADLGQLDSYDLTN